MKKPKMNKMVKICMRNKAFRDSYQNMHQKTETVSVTFLKNKEDISKNTEIEMFLEWFSNQRFPEEE
jgi:hypothetical protein